MTFPEQVAAALAKVPHSATCNVSNNAMITFPDGSRVGVLLSCTCNREARIAALVARAIREYGSAFYADQLVANCEAAALRVLEGAE